MQQSTIPLYEKVYSVRYREGRSLADRFWSYVRVGEPDECWEWQGAVRGNGYGQIGYYDTETKRQTVLGAHRISWMIHNGPITDDLHVLHECDNPRCCNPKHLFLGTHLDNMIDCIEKGRHHAVPDPAARNKRIERRRQLGKYAMKLSIDDVREIRRQFDAGVPFWATAMEFDIHPTTAWKIGKRKLRASVE